ncbi:hypothetical protein, partial [Bartonella bovis]|uniref:hypothetical protein n=1 Tax=Bartonella bovis TaxID=155194 RepID=UPI001ABB2C08
VLMTGSGTLKISGEAKIMFKGDYGVKVMGTATANITGATIKGEGSGVGSKGVIMESTGKLTINGGTIKDVAMGVEVTSGNLTVSGGSMTGVQTGIIMLGSGTLTVNSGARITVKNGGTGLSVGGTATANITGATITGSGSGKGTGVWMDGREMVMNNVQISDVAMGVEAIKGNLTIKDGTRITFTGGDRNYGVKVGELVTNARLTDLTIKGGGKGKGVIKEGGTGTLNMTGVNISNVEKAVLMNGTGKLTMTGVNISNVKMGVEAVAGNLTISGNSTITFNNGSGNYGVRVGDRVTSATLTSVKIEGKGGNGEGSKGVWMESTGTMMISGGSISKVEKGVYATGAGRLVMTGVQISKVKMGVEATNGMLVIKGNSTITFNNGSGNYGVRVKNGVTMATLTSVTIAGTGSGEGSKGVIVGSEDVGATGTKMIMEEVRISNVAMGVEVTKGILAMKGGSIGFMGEYGVSLTKSTAALMGITIKGNNQGKEGVKLNGGMVDLYKTNIREVQKGMSVENGVVRMFEGEIGFMGNYGIGLSKSTAALKNVRITGPSNKGTGVIMQNGVGAVMMKEVNISKVGTGVEVMGGDTSDERRVNWVYRRVWG